LTTGNSPEKCEWATLTREHEGFPLYVRFPLRLDYNALQHRFPVRLVLTHVFSFRRFDGLPEARYNEALEEFDSSLVTYFEASGLGQVVLVETFGGKRNYYYYVAPSVDLEAISADVRSQFPAQRIELQSGADPSWRFIRRYSSEFFDDR
jgi:hypothetical protein